MTADEINKTPSLQTNQVEMWKQWQDANEHPDHLRPLHNSFKGLIQSQVNKYKNLEALPPPLLTAKANELFLDSLRTYNPNKSAMSTHVTNNLKRLDRYVKTYQNAGRIQESRAGNFGEYLAAKTTLTDELGRSPSAEELATHMTVALNKPISSNEALRYMKEDRKDIGEASWSDDSLTRIPSASAMILRLVSQELKPEQRAVFERLFGINGARRQKPSEIALALRVHPSKISRIRKEIEKVLKKYGLQVMAG